MSFWEITHPEDRARSRRNEHNVREWYNDLAGLVRNLTFDEGVKCLILAGPKERTSEFRSLLPEDAAGRVVAEVAEESVSLKAPEGEILEKLEEARLHCEHERAAGLIQEIREGGVTGLGRTLEALQTENRVHHLVLLWDLEGEIRYSDADGLAMQDITQEESLSGSPTRVRPLIDALLDIAAARGARVDFLRGEDENTLTLRDEFQGIAGLTRF